MTKIEIEGDSEEAVALALLCMVAEAEGKMEDGSFGEDVGKAWVLDTYTECLAAVMGERELAGPEDEDDEDEDEEEEDEEEEEEVGTPPR